MAGFFDRFLGKRDSSGAAPEFSAEELEAYDRDKTEALERVLGPMAPVVDHAVVPFAVGGGVDVYYFPDTMPGTAFVTMELIGPDGSGPQPSRIGTYELIAFTRHAFTQPETQQFTAIERRMRGILTTLANYSRRAVLQPGDTVEMPPAGTEDAKCIVFDAYENPNADFVVRSKRHGLLLCVEVFRSEMEYAMQDGTAALLARLREAGAYPYSDLEREAVA